jgi:adenine-specific DNA-methyltransferase
MAKYKKLELTWLNKDKVVVWDSKKNKYVWISPEDIRAAEPRILKNCKIIGDVNTEFNPSFNQYYKSKDKIPTDEQNLLIFGDNLLALKAIEPDFFERIKLVYIDPPFNTERDDLNYPDGMEHSHWLSMMKNRLEIIWNLLRWDGAVFVHINDIEHAYLKVVLDEVFQRRNYVITITVKASSAAGHKTINPTPVNVTEYILVYAKDKSKWKYKPQFVESGYDSMYNLFIPNVHEDCSKWKIENLQEVVAKDLGFKNLKEAKIKLKQGFDVALADFALKKHKNVFRYTAINYSGVGKETQKLYDLSAKNPKKIYHLKREKYTDMYIQNKNRLTFYTTKIKKINGKEAPAKLLTNLWDDIGWHGIAKEGGVTLNRGKKPEKLLKRILDIGTEPGDWVLDSFAGSGTTGAVAHKMGRKWIMVECLPDQIKLCKTRLTNVIKGKDVSGISKIVKFKGGGGFRYCELGESLFKTDDGIIGVNYDNGDLVAAVCKIEGFKFIGREFLEKTKLHGVVNQKRYCHVTEEFVTQDLIDELAQELKEQESLVIYCMKKMSKLTLPQNIQVKKIPRDIIKKFKLGA